MNTAHPRPLLSAITAWSQAPQSQNEDYSAANLNALMGSLSALSDPDFYALAIQTISNRGPLAVLAESPRPRVEQEKVQEMVFSMIIHRAPNFTKDQKRELFAQTTFLTAAPMNQNAEVLDQDFCTRAAFTEIVLDNICVFQPQSDAQHAEKEVLALLDQIDLALGKWMDEAEQKPFNIARTQAARAAAAVVQQAGLTQGQAQNVITVLATRGSPSLPGVVKSFALQPKALPQALKAQWQKATVAPGVKSTPANISWLLGATTNLVHLFKSKERAEFLSWLEQRAPKEHEKIARSLKVKKIAQSKPIKKAALARSPQIQPQKMSF